MMERNNVRDNFFSIKREPQKRPMSVATEFVDTDWDEDDILTDFEEPTDNSPRASMHSVRRRLHLPTLSSESNGGLRAALTFASIVW